MIYAKKNLRFESYWPSTTLRKVFLKQFKLILLKDTHKQQNKFDKPILFLSKIRVVSRQH